MDGSAAVEIAVGMDADAYRGLVLPLDRTLMGLPFSAGALVTSADVVRDERISPEPPRFNGLGPAVAAHTAASARIGPGDRAGHQKRLTRYSSRSRARTSRPGRPARVGRPARRSPSQG